MGSDPSGLAGLPEEREAVEVVDPALDQAIGHHETEHSRYLHERAVVYGAHQVCGGHPVSLGHGLEQLITEPFECRQESRQAVTVGRSSAARVAQSAVVDVFEVVTDMCSDFVRVTSPERRQEGNDDGGRIGVYPQTSCAVA